LQLTELYEQEFQLGQKSLLDLIYLKGNTESELNVMK
ncbi:TolC family protein, partial [Salmonella enterica subsp. enterica serovar Typhimurium]